MHPLTVVSGVLLGSSFSIAFSLAGVMFIFAVLGSDYPRLNDEIQPLFVSFLIFTVLTTITALSFYTLLKNHAARWPLQGVQWAAVAATSLHFWP